MNNPLLFNIAMGRTKPENIRHKDADCPFCHPEQLTDILAQDGSIIWLMNKYPVLERTWQTVIIEGDDCHSEYSRFPLDKAEHVLSFSLEKWQETMARPESTSVLYFKNYGPMSGGSIRHPHSQIVGLYDYNYREDIKEYHLDGWTVGETDAYRITISDKPIIRFFRIQHSVRSSLPSTSTSTPHSTNLTIFVGRFFTVCCVIQLILLRPSHLALLCKNRTALFNVTTVCRLSYQPSR